jgi:hypothetical protein
VAQNFGKEGVKKKENYEIRFRLYREYNLITHGVGNERTGLPTCVEKHIKREYPDVAYKGFQKKK